MNKVLLLFSFVFLTSLSCYKNQNENVVVKEILNTSTSWDGKSIEYPDGEPRIISKIIEIKEGTALDFHCHPVPNFAYILEGVVEVTSLEGLKNTFSKGEAFVELTNTWHRGTAIEGPLRIVVFYAGAGDIPDTIRYSEDMEGKGCVVTE